MHAHSRRGFLRASLGACCTGAAALEAGVRTNLGHIYERLEVR